MQEYDELFNDEEMTKANTITFHANNKVLFEKVGNAGMYRLGGDDEFLYLEVHINEKVGMVEAELCRHSSIDVTIKEESVTFWCKDSSTVKTEAIEFVLSGCNWIGFVIFGKDQTTNILWKREKLNISLIPDMFNGGNFVFVEE